MADYTRTKRNDRAMIGLDNHKVERKVIAILKVLSNSQEPLGSRVIASRLKDFGIELGERAVRYRLEGLDERGLTSSVGGRDGRAITQRGIEEVDTALVSDRIGSIAARIELLAYWTSLDLEEHTGEVPINTSLFPKEEFDRALEAMKDAFISHLCASDLVAVATDAGRLGEVVVPEGKVGLATVSSVTISGVLLKAGIPGCSLDPAEVFIAGKMTKVSEAARRGEGKIVASLHELPASCRPMVENIIERLCGVGLGGMLMIGKTSDPICEVPIGPNKVGMIIPSGLNPVASAVEAGIAVVNHAMSGVIDYRSLRSFWDL